MSTLSPKDRELVLWVLNKTYPSLEHSANEDIHGPFVVKLTLDEIRSLSTILQNMILDIEGDINGCLSEASYSVLDGHLETLKSINESLSCAKPLVSEPQPELTPAPEST